MSSNASREDENPTGGNTTSFRHGIDIRQALEILSSRTSHDHSHERGNGQAACHVSVADEASRAMGQTIDLNAPAGDPSNPPEASDRSMEEAKKELDEARKARGVEIRSHLESMSVKDLLQAVLEAQRERVAAYHVYDSGLETVLQTGNMTEYPNICAQATASFSVLSDTINTIACTLTEVRKHSDLVIFLSQLQKEEREKLNLTASLHLERIRERNAAGGDERVSRLLQAGVASLKQKVTTCIDAINDVLEEIRYALAEENC